MLWKPLHKSALITIFILLCIIVTELFSFGALYILEKYKNISYRPRQIHRLNDAQKETIKKLMRGEHKYIDFDPVLGWSLKPNSQTDNYRSNAQGLRAEKDYLPTPPAGITRIATFGDSFTHGDEVTNKDTFQHQMEALDESIEVLNFGVGGYGPDQAYLRYRKIGAELNPHIVLIGFSPMDTFRAVNVFRPFFDPRTGVPLAKPRFTPAKNDSFSLLPNPIQDVNDYRLLLNDNAALFKQLGINDFFYNRFYTESLLDFFATTRLIKIYFQALKEKTFWKKETLVNGYYNPLSEAFKITAFITLTFYDEALRNGAFPVIVILPDKIGIKQWKKTGRKEYRYFIDLFQQSYCQVIDTMEIFENIPLEELDRYFLKIHYSPETNRLIAEYIYQELQNKKFLNQEYISDYVKKYNALMQKYDEPRSW